MYGTVSHVASILHTQLLKVVLTLLSLRYLRAQHTLRTGSITNGVG